LSVEIRVSLWKVNAKPPLKALADVVIRVENDEITIHRCAVFEKPGGPPWANLPRHPIEKNGQRQYIALIDLSRELKRRVLGAVLEEYRKQADAG
jgi:hypothetical protein